MLPPEVPVLIVGAGPSGTLASLLLEQQGIETLLVERRAGAQRAPAAHVVNARTLEICRQGGLDRKALADAAQDPEDAGYAYFVTKLGGQVLGRLPFERQGDDQLALTPSPLRNLSQNRFEPILFEALERLAGKTPRWGQQWESAVQGPDGVRSRIRDRETGREHEVSSRYLVAADGAGSRVRKSLGIALAGPERIRSFVMIHLRASLRGVPEIPPGNLFFTCDPASGGGVFVVHDLDREAVYMHPLEPDEEAEGYDAARCERIVRRALADPSLDFEVETIGSWVMTAQVAERYREGRIFLLGDAAHRFPPTGGLGLNSGAQDAHNLAWKVAFVLKDLAPESLLDTFESERRPVAQRNADQSLRNALQLAQVPQALGITDFSEASRAKMQATLADPAGLARVREAVAQQAEHFDMPGLQLGFAYAEGALLHGPGEKPPDPPDVRDFVPSGRPGARLPHAWVAAAGERRSLLDEVPLDRCVLFAGPEGQAWLDAAAAIDAPLEVRLLSAGLVPELEAWLGIAGIEPSGALLVRPDQHVGWRAPRLPADPSRELRRAVDAVMGRTGGRS